ncbi:MAG: hypothetical protein ACYC6J_09170 [Coriobacteriia bacterium]
MRVAFTVALLVSMVLLVAYQAFMLWWTKKTAGSIPTSIRLLRGINIGLLLGGGILIVWQLVEG